MTQQRKVSKNKTCTVVDLKNNYISVVYHNTEVVKVTKKSIILNTGGWFTSTTKTRMNQASNQFSLGYYVYQKDFNWFVDYKNITIPFTTSVLEINI